MKHLFRIFCDMGEMIMKRTMRRHILQACFALLCAIVVLVSISFMEPIEETSYIDAYQFVKSWNTLAGSENNLTQGVKISAAIGRHTFHLGKDIFLHYRVEKAGILHRKISFILYESQHLSEFGIHAYAVQMLDMLQSQHLDCTKPYKSAGQKIQGLLFTYDVEKKGVQITSVYAKFPFSNLT